MRRVYRGREGLLRGHSGSRLRRALSSIQDTANIVPNGLQSSSFSFKLWASVMRSMAQDLRFGLRMLTKHRGFTLVAVLTLGLAIGANTAIFTVVQSVMLDSVPFEEPDDLVWLNERTAEYPLVPVSYLNFLDWQERNHVFAAMAAHRRVSYNFSGSGGERPESVDAVQCSAPLFSLLGVEALLGRTFTAEEDQPEGPRVVVLSHGLWQRMFGGRRDVVGTNLSLEGVPHEILGVMPQGFTYPLVDGRVEAWVPLGRHASRWSDRSARAQIFVTARLRQGVSLEAAQNEMDRIAANLAAEFPQSNDGHGVAVTSLRSQTVRHLRTTLLLLSAAVGLVLLLACVNVANLLLARATARDQEIALRSALGASQGQIVLQLLVESVLLALAGGVVGLGIAFAALRAIVLVLIDPARLPANSTISIDSGTFFFTLVLSVVTGVIFGLVPSLQSRRPDLAKTLREGAKGSMGIGRRRLRGTLVVAQVAMAQILLIGAMLFVRTLDRLHRFHPGFEARNVLSFQIRLPPAAYPETAQQKAFFDELLLRLQNLPGVISAGVTVPFLGDWFSSLVVQGRTPSPGEKLVVETLWVSPDLFETLGMRVIRGRGFTSTDRENGTPVAVVDTLLADSLWPGEDPVGKRVKLSAELDSPEPWLEVLGVVNHVRSYGPKEGSSMKIYMPWAQDSFSAATMVVRTISDPLPLVDLLEQEVWSIDPRQPLDNVQVLEERMAAWAQTERFSAALLGTFAAVAIVLSSIGIYGLISYSVAQRRREIGIRMALGAHPTQVVRQVIGEGLLLALFGVGAGLAVAFVATPLIASQLYEVNPHDPATLLGLPVALTLVVVSACLIPALSASRIEPVLALRHE